MCVCVGAEVCMSACASIKVCFFPPVWPAWVRVSIHYMWTEIITEHLSQCINMCTPVKASTAVYCDAYYVIQQLIGSLSYKSPRWGDLAFRCVTPHRNIWGTCRSSPATCRLRQEKSLRLLEMIRTKKKKKAPVRRRICTHLNLHGSGHTNARILYEHSLLGLQAMIIFTHLWCFLIYWLVVQSMKLSEKSEKCLLQFHVLLEQFMNSFIDHSDIELRKAADIQRCSLHSLLHVFLLKKTLSLAHAGVTYFGWSELSWGPCGRVQTGHN